MRAGADMTWKTNGEEAEVTLAGHINVWCEKLPPFNVMPRRVLQPTSNAVLGTAFKGLQRVFLKELMKDYVRWANDEEYRIERAQMTVNNNEGEM